MNDYTGYAGKPNRLMKICLFCIHYKLVNNEWQCLLHNEAARFDHVCSNYSDWHEHVKVHNNNQNGYNNQINKIQEM